MDWSDLNATELHVCYEIANLESPSGRQLLEETEDSLKMDRARVYQVLADLRELGLVEEQAVDGREMQNQLTEAGRELLRAHAEWVRSRVPG